MFDSVQADLYDFADDNNLSAVGNTIDEAKAVLITETEAAINDRKPRKISFDVPFCKQIGPKTQTVKVKGEYSAKRQGKQLLFLEFYFLMFT